MKNEPVAWINKTTLQYLTELGYCAKVYPKRSDGDIPLYTHPVKELTDEDWGDRKDQWTDAIQAEHPLNTKDYKTYEMAMEMVGNRHGKFALVALVNWLLRKAQK